MDDLNLQIDSIRQQGEIVDTISQTVTLVSSLIDRVIALEEQVKQLQQETNPGVHADMHGED